MTPQQFLSPGFAERKLMLLYDAVELCKRRGEGAFSVSLLVHSRVLDLRRLTEVFTWSLSLVTLRF